jgi:hypothetical protein
MSTAPAPAEVNPATAPAARDATPARRGRGVALVVVATASVAVSLVLREVHRAGYYAGWDLLGSAEGLFLVSTRTLAELWRWYIVHHHDSSMAWSTYGVPLALLPGWLASLWPGEHWSTLVTFSLTVVSLFWLGRALWLEGAEWGVLVLAWGASSTLLSWSIAGFGYMSGVWPHALALWIVMRWRRRWFTTLLLALVAIELSWNGQELGRTIFVVFLAAALLLRPAPLPTRLVWLLAGGWALWDVWHHPTFNSGRYSHVDFGSDAGALLMALASKVFVECYLDLPVLFVVGLASILCLRRDRWFWRAIVGVQAGLVVLLALNSGILQGVGAVWPRRILLVDFLCLAVTVALYRELSGRRLAAALIAVLLLGNGWQLADTWRWSREPLDRHGTGVDYPLPYTQTTVDYTVPFALVDWAHDMAADVARGRRLILVYNFSSFDESTTNPTAVLERLYLTLGHPKFSQSVFVFGSVAVRWNDFPIRPMSELPGFVQGLSDPGSYDGYYRSPYRSPHPSDAPTFAQEASAIFAALETSWDVVWQDDRPTPHAGHIHRFGLAAYPEG